MEFYHEAPGKHEDFVRADFLPEVHKSVFINPVLKKRRTKRLIIALVVLSTPTIACADVVWQLVFLCPTSLARTWWVIPLCLSIEYPVVRTITGAGWVRCALLTVFMNVVSFGAGLIIQLPAMAVDGYSRLAWLFLLGTIGSTLIEGGIIKMFYLRSMTWSRLCLLGGINALTTDVTLVAAVYALQ